MTYVYEPVEEDPHQNCHKIDVTTITDLRLGRRAFIDQRCEQCRVEIAEIDRLRAEIVGLRALITDWADAYDNGEADDWHVAGDALRKAVGR